MCVCVCLRVEDTVQVEFFIGAVGMIVSMCILSGPLLYEVLSLIR